MKRLLLTLTLLVPALSFGANQASTASTADAANVVIPGLGVTENQLVWWAKEIIPDKFKGPERCWFIMTKMIPTWKKNLRSFHRYADYTTDQKTFPGGSRYLNHLNFLEEALFTPALIIRGAKVTHLSDAFFNLFPKSCWTTLDLTGCPKLSNAAREELTKVWLAEGRKLENLIFAGQSSSSSSASAASTAAAASTLT